LDTGASINNGSAIAINGAVTLDGNTISLPTQSVTTISPTPEPSSLILLASGLIAMAFLVRRRFGASTGVAMPLAGGGNA